MLKIERPFNKQSGIKGILSLWIIFLLRKKSMNGYELIKEIESNTKHWKPATGAIYPALCRLKKMGLITIERTGPRDQKIYTLTDSGKFLAKQIMKNMTKKIRDIRSRRILDSLVWPNEPEEIQKIFETLLIAIFDFRNSLKNKYKDPTYMKKAKTKIIKIIEELKAGI